MKVFVCVPMEDGIVRGVRVFRTEDSAKGAEQAWLEARGIEDEKKREKASDWGTGHAIWTCDLEPQPVTEAE